MNLHALAEPGQGAWFFLVASLSKPALNAPHIPVQLLGEPFQTLLIRMLWNKAPEKPFLSIFYLHHLQVLSYVWLNFPSNFYCRHFNIYDWESSPPIWSMNKDNTYITHYETRQKNKNLAPNACIFSCQQRLLVKQPATKRGRTSQLAESVPSDFKGRIYRDINTYFTFSEEKRKYIFTL